MRAIVLTTRQWKQIRTALKEEYTPAVFMLRNKMKHVLGFTVREHSSWVDGEHQFQIHLDFYSANKRTMFLLKFSDIIGNIDEKR